MNMISRFWHNLLLRYKVFIVLVFVPLISLFIYSQVAIYVFESDKIAYVFETSSALNRSVSMQSKNVLLNLQKTLIPLYQDFAVQKSFGVLSQSIFNSDPQIQSIVVFKVSSAELNLKESANQPATKPSTQLPAQPVILTQMEKSQGIIQELIRQTPQFNEYILTAKSKNRLIVTPFQDERILFFEKIESKDKTESFVVLCFTYANELVDAFQNQGLTKVFLTDYDGEILFSGKNNILKNSENKKNISFKNINSFSKIDFLKNFTTSPLVEGTQFVEEKASTKKWLASYAKVGFGDLMVLSYVPQAEVLTAIRSLFYKSLLFIGILIGLTVLLSILISHQLTETLDLLVGATRKISQGVFNVQLTVKSKDEVGLLSQSFNTMSQEVARLLEETTIKTRMEAELKTARLVQETLFPKADFNFENISIAGHYEPATECGGDWWYYKLIGRRIFLSIGDATGHGAPAALVTSAAKSACTLIERLELSVGESLEHLNHSIFEVTQSKIMMTCFMGYYDLDTQILTYSVASHDPPILFLKSEVPIKKNDLVLLNEVNNFRLGQDLDTKYSEAQITLKKGDSILFYTDGVSELKNPKDELLGERVFIKKISERIAKGWSIDFNDISYSNSNSNSNANSINKTEFNRVRGVVDSFLLDLNEHRNNAPLADDVTYFILQIEG